MRLAQTDAPQKEKPWITKTDLDALERVGAAVLADLVVAVVQVALGVARPLGVVRPPAVQAGQGVMKVKAVRPAPSASVLSAPLVPLATASVGHTATAPRGHSAMATADLRVRREMGSAALTVIGRIGRRAQPEMASAEVLANGQSDRAARREMGNAALTVIDRSVPAVRRATESAEVLANGQSDRAARREIGSTALTVIDPLGLPVKVASDLHAQPATVSDVHSAIAPLGLRVMANEDLLEAGRVGRKMVGNGPSGSAASSDVMSASEVLKFRIR